MRIDELGDSAVHLSVRFWVGNPTRTDILDVRTRFGSEAKDRLLAEGVTVAPASTHRPSGALAVESVGDPAE